MKKTEVILGSQQRTIEEERQYRKERLAASFRLFAKYDYDMGVAGHITARDPEYSDHFWVNPFAMDFSQIKVSDLVLANHQGKVIQGNKPINKAAFAIHSRIHEARPDVIAAAHSHSIYGKSFSSLGKLLDPITQDACAFYEDHGLFDDYTGVVLDLEEGERIARALKNYKAVILRNHGLLTVGRSVEEAAWWFISMERSCQAQLLAESAGKPIKIDHEQALKTRGQVGTFQAKINFEPMWERIIKQEPDLLN